MEKPGRMMRRRCAWWLRAGVTLLLAGCTHTLVLRNAAVPVASHAARPARVPCRFYIDTIKPPYLNHGRIGIKRSLAGRYLAHLCTESDVAAWAQGEWRAYLVRHQQTVAARPEESDYIIQCDILELHTEKKYDWIWDDDFFARIRLNVVIRNRTLTKDVLRKKWAMNYNVERPHEQNDSVPDEVMFNRCLSTVFQQALEQLALPGPPVAK